MTTINIKKELTAYEITEAFPEECLEYIPKAIEVMESKILFINERLHYVDGMNIGDGYKKIYKMFIEFEKPIKSTKLLDKYKKVLEILKNKEKGSMVDNSQKINKAKSIPIDSLYDFQNKKESSLRIQCSCPFHEDKTPSFMIYKNTKSFHCFSCKASGDSISFYMKLNNTTFQRAMEDLSK